MAKYVSLKELRPGLPRVVKEASGKSERFIITRRGKPEAVLIGADDYEDLVETLEILSDKALMKRLAKGKEEVEKGMTVPFDELRSRIEKV
jgi:antitoxin YefM